MASVFRKQIFCCVSEGEGKCASKGGMELLLKFREEVKARGLTDVLVTKVGCTSQHHCGPTVIVHPDGLWYRQVTTADVAEIIEKHIMGGQPVERLLNPNVCVKPD
jgi:(2Fe-2S) ferredoxin